MPGINPSEFRQVFRFENPNKQGNTSAGQDENYIGVLTTKGKWEQVDGHRDFSDGVDQLISVYRVTCYWRSAIEAMLTKDTALIYNNTPYRIERINLVKEARTFYQFLVSEAH